MNTHRNSSASRLPKYSERAFAIKQRGAVLAVSLVLLLVMTILGISNMKSSSLELKMVKNTESRQHAFQAAETALLVAERLSLIHI